MKKLILSALAISFLAACKKEETVTPVINASPVVVLSKYDNSRLSSTVGDYSSYSATATDADGTISKVVFYANNVAYDTVTVPGWNTRTSASVMNNTYFPKSYKSTVAGNVVFTAKAMDDKGAIETSNAITENFTAPVAVEAGPAKAEMVK